MSQPMHEQFREALRIMDANGIYMLSPPGGTRKELRRFFGAELAPLKADNFDKLVLGVNAHQGPVFLSFSVQYIDGNRIVRTENEGYDSDLYESESESGTDMFAAAMRRRGLSYTAFDLETAPYKIHYAYQKAKTLPVRKSALIAYPNVIRGVPVDMNILWQLLKNLAKKQALSETETPEWTTGRKAGNSCLRYGLSVPDYIRAAYAYNLVCKCRNFTVNGHPKPEDKAYLDIYRLFLRTKSDGVQYFDPQKADRTAPEDIIGSPDPEAYRVITKINNPKLEREPGNNDTKTFDFVRIFLGVCGVWSFPDRKAHIRKYQKDIALIALNKIAGSAIYKKKGVPVQFLRLSSMTLTQQDELELVFELKTRPKGASQS